MAAEAGHHPNRAYFDQDGNIHLNGASLFDASENDVKNAVAGVSAGVKVAGGEVALDGSNPTAIATGLTTVVGFSATIQGSSAPGDNTSVLTFTVSGGTVSVYAWKNTSGTDPTLVASTGTETISWVAVGT